MNKRLPRILRAITSQGVGGGAAELFAGIARKLRRRFPAPTVTTVDYLGSDYEREVERPPQIRLQPVGKQTGARLNVVMPHLLKTQGFGGIWSAVFLARHLSNHYSDVRFISLDYPLKGELFRPDELVADLAQTRIEMVDLAANQVLECHEHDIFLCTAWWTVLAWESYAAALLERGFRVNPFYYFIQDFEPGFHAFGSQYALALRTYSHGEHTSAICNSEELAEYLRGEGFSFHKEYTLKPSLHPKLKGYLEQHQAGIPRSGDSTVHILCYGRPREARNCFPILLRGLHLYFSHVPEHKRSGFSVISAGNSHPDIILCPGVVVKSVGKVTFEDYMELLTWADIGVSLMVSPHPSYPPLEMAAFGAITITNNFANKDLSRGHPLIRAIDHATPDLLAQALEKAVPEAIRRQNTKRDAVLPQALSQLPWQDNIRAAGILPLVSQNQSARPVHEATGNRPENGVGHL